MRNQVEAQFAVDGHAAALSVFGQADRNLRLLEEALNVRIYPKGNTLDIRGTPSEVEKAVRVLTDLLHLFRSSDEVTIQAVETSIRLAKEGDAITVGDLASDIVVVTARGKRIAPKSVGQKRYVEALRSHSILFCIGPAGTGKSYLALAVAVAAMKAKEVHRLVLTRPAVEAGEKLGFLPGDLHEKVDPYLRPLYDALHDILGPEGFQRAVERNQIEVAPLAYMRGRTLEDAFIVLDEAQNTTPEQMKMFLTRMGVGSKMVITGDVTQVDLPAGVTSGLVEAQQVLQGIPGIGFVYLNESDVVRHPLVQQIILAYERHRETERYAVQPVPAAAEVAVARENGQVRSACACAGTSGGREAGDRS